MSLGLSLLVLFAVCLFCVSPVSAFPDDWDAIPPWAQTANQTTRGTLCYCIIQESEFSLAKYSRCATLYNENDFVDPVGGYTCNCGENSMHCGLGAELATTAQEDGRGTCASLDGNVTTAWSEEAPACKDAFGNTCGGLPGVRTDTRVIYNNPYDLRLDTYGQVVQGVDCRIITVRALCTTPLCPNQPIDCEEEQEYGAWSACTPFQDTCLKTRVKGIRVNASDGGIACRSLAARTETTTCTLTECQKVRCNYTSVTVTGNCTDACGLTTRNVTVYNVSTTPLSICAQGTQSVVSVTEIPCLNVPCTESGEAINITCETNGYQGYLGSAVKYVILSLGGLEISSNHTNTSFANHLTVSVKVSGREMPYDVNGVIYTGTEIWLPLKTSAADFAKNTGLTFKVQYIAPDKTNHTLMAGGQVVPSFICNTQDKVAPVLIRAFRAPSEGLTFAMEFSEPVKWADPGSAPGYLSTFRFNNFQNVDPTPTSPTVTLEANSFATIYLLPEDPFQLGVYANASIQMITDQIVDLSGNPVVINGSLIPVETDIDGGGEGGGVNQALPSGAYDTIKIYSNNSRGVPDSAYIMTTFPLERPNVDLNLAEAFLIVNVTINGTTTSTSSPGIAAYYENPWYDPYEGDTPSTFVMGFILQFASDNPFLNQVFNESFNLSAATVTYSLYLGADVAHPASISGFTSEASDLPVDNITNVEPPGVHTVTAYAGSTYICLNFTTARTSGAAELTASDFFYRGPNRVISIHNQSATAACLTMESAVDYSAFEADRIIFLDTGAPGIRPPLFEHPIVSLSGVRPRIVSGKIYNSAGGKTWDKLTVVFDAPITDPEVDDASELVTFTWDNPAIQSVVATAYSVSDRTVNFTLKTTCVDVCADTGSGVRFELSGLTSATGASVLQASKFQAADISRPRLESAIKFSTYSYVFNPSEDLDTTKHLWTRGLQPPPEDCNFLGRDEWVCLMEEGFDNTEVITVDGVFAVDRNDNYELIELETTAKVLHESSGCSSFFDLPLYYVVPASVLMAVPVIALAVWGFNKVFPNTRGK